MESMQQSDQDAYRAGSMGWGSVGLNCSPDAVLLCE